MKTLGYILIVLFLSSCGNNATKSEITAEMAYEGVNNYCHSEYDWSIAEANPSIMYVKMGEETDSAYQVVFRSYTGAIVNFYVDKESGMTKIVESSPTLDVKEETKTINIFDYLKKEKSTELLSRKKSLCSIAIKTVVEIMAIAADLNPKSASILCFH